MKVRVKWTKTGVLKFIGHLDVQRYFQKALMRAELPVSFSKGMSPHQIMSFAAPLGLGMTSEGEYADISFDWTYSSEEMLSRINAVMNEGISVLEFKEIDEKEKNCMAVTAAADYLVTFREGYYYKDAFLKRTQPFSMQEKIPIVKKTKRSEKEVDIAPMILDIREYESEPLLPGLPLKQEGIFMKLVTGSAENLKPQLVMEAFCKYLGYDYDNYRYYLGPDIQIGNVYPQYFSRTFYEGLKEQGEKTVVNLVRCAWAGSQRYGALVWSGDIHSDWPTFRRQVSAGLNMGIAGIPWWTTDIGGFSGARPEDPRFQQLFVRWFEWGTFCPVMRLHGDRDPHYKPLGTTGGGKVASGADNEIWSYTPEIQDMMSYYILLRESMKGYMTTVMEEAHEKGTPVMKPLFYDYPADKTCWEIADEFLFGHDLLVAPVLYAGERTRTLYLPEGRWCEYETGKVYDGGCTITVDAPINRVPLFVKEGKTVFVK
mgnify:CR=1 FL=1